jgi:hypothetical protein
LADNAPLSELIDTENISLPSQNMKFEKTMNITIKGKIQQS